MSDYQGVPAAATKGNPVIKWTKKHPALAAGIVGGAVLLVVLFKPKESAAPQSSGEVAVGEYYPGMDGGSGGADYGGDIANLYTELDALYGALGTMSDENAAQMDALSGWVEDSLGSFSGDISSQLDSALSDIYGQLDSFAAMNQMQQQPIQQANPYQQLNPLTGQPLSSLPSALSTGIKRLDLNIPEPETFSIRSAMDQIGDRWGAIQAATGRNDSDEQIDLHAQNLLSAARIGGQFNPTTGTYSWLTQPVTSFRSDLVLTGNNQTDYAKAQIAAIGEQWGAADEATRKTLHARAESIAAAAGGVFNPTTGTYTWS